MRFWARSSILAALNGKITPPETPPEGRKGRTVEVELGQRPIDLEGLGHGLASLGADVVVCISSTSAPSRIPSVPLGARGKPQAPPGAREGRTIESERGQRPADL